MKPKFAGLLLAMSVFAYALWLLLRSSPQLASIRTQSETSDLSTSPPRLAEMAKVPSPLSATLPVTATPNAARQPSLTGGSPVPVAAFDDTQGLTKGSFARDPQVDAVKIRNMVHGFHTLMGENPVGTNAEIMHQMMGGNSRQAQLGPPEGMLLNDKGELVDQWNTPYFFHQLSKDLMEVHSAGPDKVFGTPDDIVIR